jgi:hypothetical protein
MIGRHVLATDCGNLLAQDRLRSGTFALNNSKFIFDFLGEMDEIRSSSKTGWGRA